MRTRCPALGATLLLLVSAGLAAAQETATTVLIGRVVVEGTGSPLPYASITLNGRSGQFTDSLGRFQVEGLASGDVAVRARRIGYSPAEQVTRVNRGDTTRVVLRMARVAIQLPAVHATARVCTNPGPPDRRADPGLAQLFTQLQQNAETFRLLSAAYPYVYASQRQFVTTLNDSVIERTPMETLAGSSARTWKYEAGRMIVQADAKTSMHLPTLGVFADENFARSHCFDYAGVVELDGMSLVRVDFTPDARIREPDISGSIYLDPASYQIRRSDLVLTKVPYHLSGQMTGHTVTTFFTEVVPGVPIIGAFRAAVMKLREGEVRTELQQVVEVQFLGGKP